MESFYLRRDESTFESTPATAGPWGPHSQHAGPPSALLVKAIEERYVAVDQRLGRVSVDILGPIPVAPISVTTTVIRPGKRTALIEATGTAGDRSVLCVRAWRFPRIAGDYPATAEAVSDLRDEIDRADEGGVIPGAHVDGYLSAAQFRFTTGSFAEFGPVEAWGRSLRTLPGEVLTPWQRVLILADSSSGLSLTADPRRYPAINSDLLVVLHRDPVGDWIGIEAETHSARGHGAAAYARLTDSSGIVGSCTQSLYASIAGQ